MEQTTGSWMAANQRCIRGSQDVEPGTCSTFAGPQSELLRSDHHPCTVFY